MTFNRRSFCRTLAGAVFSVAAGMFAVEPDWTSGRFSAERIWQWKMAIGKLYVAELRENRCKG